MFSASFEGKTCPIFDETLKYELANNKQVNETMQRHNTEVKSFLQQRLNITEDIDEQWIKRIIDEMTTNEFEQRYTPYAKVTKEEWDRLFSYLVDYLYEYMFGNDTLNRILSSELFRYIMDHFDNKAKAALGMTSKNTAFMDKRKYSYISGRGSEMPMILQALKIAKENRMLP